jgi:hypothetical protein
MDEVIALRSPAESGFNIVERAEELAPFFLRENNYLPWYYM